MKSIFRLGKSIEKKSVLVCFAHQMKWKSLRFSKVKEPHELDLSVANDLSGDERIERKSILMYLSSLREQGHQANLKGNAIVIKN